MKTLAKQQNARIPSWALSYLINGESEGLAPVDKDTVDSWWSGMVEWAESIGGQGQDIIINPVDTNEFFTWHPEFGLACTVTECDIVVLGVDNKESV